MRPWCNKKNAKYIKLHKLELCMFSIHQNNMRKRKLTPEHAFWIYVCKINIHKQKSPLVVDFHRRLLCSDIARVHNVSKKAIRDIWNRKSWIKATSCLWTYFKEKDDTEISLIEELFVTKNDKESIEKLNSDPFHFDWVEPTTPF